MSNLHRSLIFLALSGVSVSAWASAPFLNRDTLLAPQALANTASGPKVYSERSNAAPETAPLPSDLQYLNRVVAVVNDQIITSMQLDEHVAAIRARLQQQDPQQMPPEGILRRQVLQQLILQDIEIQMAKRMDIHVGDGTLDKAVDSIARSNNLTPDQLREALTQQGQSWDAFRRDLTDRIMVDRLTQQEVESRVHLGPDEVKTFARQLKDIGGVSFKLRQILIPLPADPSPEAVGQARQQANDVLAKLRNGANFSRLATEVSAGSDALQGGQVGWVKAAELPNAVTQNLLALKPGEVSAVIPSPTGFRIFQLEDVKHEAPSVTEVKTAMIVLHANDGLQLQEAESQAKDIESALQGGGKFSALAHSYSQDAKTAAQGGELGWVAPGQLPDVLERTLLSLQDGAVSSPVRVGNELYIVQAQDRRQIPVADAQLDAVAREQLFNRTVRQRLDEWQRRIRDGAYVEILDPDLRPQSA